MSSNPKLFADDTSLISVRCHLNTSVTEINDDFKSRSLEASTSMLYFHGKEINPILI